MLAVVRRQSLRKGEFSWCSKIESLSRSLEGEVTHARLTTAQKKACARHACITEITVGKKKRTVMPPKTP
jgi:hypothetical protein